MLVAFVGLALATASAVLTQGVSSAIAPSQSPPPGCSFDYEGSFTYVPVNVSSSRKRDSSDVSQFASSIFGDLSTHVDLYRRISLKLLLL